ncbi:AAA family ATPase [Inquilinus limosus]|uniref:Phosphotransferase n=1 Tax=Inquilinus limosus MP06 TaxID=1398085 RepID=A0A0A0D0M3_9PROT|nr:AAA family ATPase [Inquilinus limosus]KGM31615.1 phosphotransferase [Inquilinus limosus MP06]
MTTEADLPGILVVTGIMAAGKSTVAQALAERLPRAVHLRGDVFRRMIVSGRVEVTPDLPAEATRQLDLRYELSATVAGRYADSGFAVVWQDVILGPALARVARLLRGRSFGIVVLCPSPEAVAAREAGRPKTGYGAWTPADLDRGMRADTPRLGLWLDSSGLTVGETVDAILARIAETRAGLP